MTPRRSFPPGPTLVAQFPRSLSAIRWSVLALLLANLWPLVGVVLLGWTVFSVVLLFWLENVIVGVFNVLRMALARGTDPATVAGKGYLIPFFTVHYGLFTLVHGVFVFVLFGGALQGDSPGRIAETVRAAHVGPAALALFASHGISFVSNYLLSGEFRTATLRTLMAAPYGRVVVLHLVIMGGGFLVMLLRSALLPLALLVVLKVGLDLNAHVREHTGTGLPIPRRRRPA